MLGGVFMPEPDVVSIALFDLDNTLIGGDSDYLWGCFLAERGIVDGAYYEQENQRFYDEYKAGVLDIHEFLRFQLKPLAEHDMATLIDLRRHYIAEKIKPIVLPRAQRLIQEHRTLGHTPVIITATNRFITGVGKISDDFIILLDLENLFSPDEIVGLMGREVVEQ